ncbi:MAG: hypothetical protein GEU90_05115 [Gemmatimonas sp.]|nr:hypothetical protein [Gemmatimonas sp.]
MRKLLGLGLAFGLITTASPAEGQLDGRLSAEPFVGYGFFGELSDSDVELEADLMLGGRVAYELAPQWSVFGTVQRSSPSVSGSIGPVEIEEGEIVVYHWSVGGEFSYVPRGGAEGMLPILIEAGIGQARYEDPFDFSDLAVNLGIASALQLSDFVAVRFGANDYISNYGESDFGVVNQVFVRVGAELSF